MKLEYVKRLIVCRTRNKNYHFLPLIRNRCCGKSRMVKYVAGDQIYGSRPFRKPISQELQVNFSLQSRRKMKFISYICHLWPMWKTLSLINFHDFDYFVQATKTTNISHTIYLLIHLLTSWHIWWLHRS